MLLFTLDLATPLGVADGIGYTPLLTVTLFLSGRRSTIIAAFMFSALIVVGQLFGVGWVVAAVIVERKAAQAKFDAAAREEKSWLERLFGYVPNPTSAPGSAGIDPNIWEAANL